MDNLSETQKIMKVWWVIFMVSQRKLQEILKNKISYSNFIYFELFYGTKISECLINKENFFKRFPSLSYMRYCN